MNESKLNIIFMGTPEFAVPTLEALHRQFGVKAVVTIPDKPQGRGQKLQPSPVKIKALELGLPVLQPESLKDDSFVTELGNYNPDIMCVVAFRILPEKVYSMSTIGTFNVHGSLLPKYRGAAPINWAIINGDKESGLTTFLLDKTVDTGSMLLQRKVVINDDYTAGDLHDLLMPVSAEIAIATCNLLIDGNYTPLKQDDTLATPAPKLFPEKCKINWSQSAEEVKNYIHGLSPYPGAWTTWNGERLKIYRVSPASKHNGEPGTYWLDNKCFYVNCGSDSLQIIEMQLQGKRAMKADDFVRGYRGEEKGKFE